MSILVLNKINLKRLDYIHHLRSLDTPIHLICDAASFPEASRTDYEEFFDHIELIDGYLTSGKVEQKVLELHPKLNFQRIIAVSELDLIRAGRLRDQLGLAGQSGQSARTFRDKLLMKKTAGGNGIKVPNARRVTCVMDILEFVKDYGLPVVIKPVLGCGAVNTHIVRTQAKLHQVLALKLAENPDALPNLEIEEYISGQMYHIDGYVENGEIVGSWPSRYVNSCHDFAGGTVLGTHTLQQDNPLVPRMQAFAAQLLSALPTPHTTAFHAEFFHTPQDEFVLCEIASRVGGPRIPESYRTATGFDLIDALIRGQAGCPLSPLQLEKARIRPNQVGGMLLIPARRGRLELAPQTCPLTYVSDYLFTGRQGQVYQASHDHNDFVAAFLLAPAKDEVEMQERIAAAGVWFDQSTQWSTIA